MPKIYRITYCHSNEGFCIEWAGSMAAARKAVNKIKADDIAQAQDTYADLLASDLVEDGATYHNHKKIDYEDIEITAIDFPTRKKEIVDWLSIYLCRDNG